MSNLVRIIERINQSAWAILPDKLDAIGELIQRKLQGENIPMESAARRRDDEEEETTYLQVNPDGIAVLSIMGTLGRRMSLIEQASGGVSMEILSRDLLRAQDNPQVRGMLLHIDSPGGTVDGTRELADLVAECGRKKPVYAYADGQICSGAYWVGAAARKVFASSTTQVGSIGVVAMHVDRSKRDEQWGVKRTYIYNGKYKRLVNDAEPLSDEGRLYMQHMIDQVYGIFVEDVARYRNMTPDAVMKQESRVYLAGEAKEQNLVDEVATYPQAYAQLQKEVKNMDYTQWKADFPQHVTQHKNEIVSVLGVGELPPALLGGVQKESADAERNRVLGIIAVELGDECAAKYRALVESGVTVEQYQAIKAMQPAAAQKDDKKDEILSALHRASPENPGPTSGKEGAKDYMIRVEEHAAAHKCSKTEAMQAVRKANPKEYQAWLASKQVH